MLPMWLKIAAYGIVGGILLVLLTADAIINVRFMTTSVIGSAAELLAYGTAVKLNSPTT